MWMARATTRATTLAALLAVAALLAPTVSACAPSTDAPQSNTSQNGTRVTAAIVPAPIEQSVDASAPAFQFTTDTRVLAGGAAAATATLAAEQLAAQLSTPVSVAITDASPAGTADIALVLSDDKALGAEGYRLVVSDGVRIEASTTTGLFYGVQSLRQLTSTSGAAPATTITDSPRFGYRGVMLDVARYFHGLDTVKAYIDRASSLKFNALHLHLSDDQGWRIQIDAYPKLTELASGSDMAGGTGGFFTKNDYREIVDYAAARHMIVVPEIDTPGHTHAVSLAYPELVEEPVILDYMKPSDPGGIPVSGEPYTGGTVGFSSLKIDEERTYEFLTTVFTELAEMTPGPYLHLGGDEALGTAPADFVRFITRTADIVAATGKTPIAWHEAGESRELPAGTVGQYWNYRTPQEGHAEKAVSFTLQGGKLIFSPADAIYLDMKYDEATPLGLSWAGLTDVATSYDWDPASVFPGVGDADILGVEAPMWSETLRSLADIDAMAFPRIASAAEIAWSPAAGTTEQRNWDSFSARVGALGPHWSALGIAFSARDEIAWVTGE